MSEAPVIVVTGASRGVGRWLAERAVQRGWSVVGCSRGESTLVAGSYVHIRCDISSEDDVRGLFNEARKRFGRVDHLVNNAGVASMNHALLTPAATVRRLLDINTVGTFLCCREAAKAMQRYRKGRIVNISSVAVALDLEGEAAYAASKAAVESMTRVLSREFAPFNITVNAVAPTPIDTDLIRGVPRDKLEALILRQGIKRWGTMEDVGNVIDFFLDERSGFVTGQVLYLGGVS